MNRTDLSLNALRIMLRASQSVEGALKKDMNRYGLNSTEFTVMELLYNKGKQPIQMLGKKILLASSSITYVVDKLESKGYIERIPDTKDRRVTYVELTESGRNKMEEIFPNHAQVIKHMFDVLEEDEIRQLNDTLKKLGYHVEDREVPE